LGRVLVVGLRATGESVVRHFAEAGDVVTVVDERPDAPGYAGRAGAARALGATVVERPGSDDWPVLVAGVDLVVPSPGIAPGHPVFAAAGAVGVPVRGDVDVAVELAAAPVVAITGTNGKSTVTMLTTAMLEASGVRAVAAGNIGYPLLDAIRRPADVYVVEVSSFQLHTATCSFRPRVAVLLNVADDHLDWHGSFEEYARVKGNVFRHQDADGVLVANAQDPVVRELATAAPGRTDWFTLDADPTAYHVAHGRLLAPDGAELAIVQELELRAPHDVANALAAAAASRAAGATLDGIRGAIRASRRLHHRVEPVGKAGGVTFVDDSKATNPHAALAALRGFDRVVLIAGGLSKGVDLGALAAESGRMRAVVAIGDTPEEVEAAFAGTEVPVRRAASMDDAVRRAAALAEEGDVVLLSPACASFDWFDSYEHRGQVFRDAVTGLVAAGGAA
jgi:UDP-N-acetylmuramoylalanine--D-glutamate ligase